MNKIISYYTKYREYVPEYKKWENTDAKNTDNASSDIAAKQNTESLKQKAKAIANPILVADSYEHEKAEDSETFFQTLNIELMSIAGLITSLPVAITKIIPLLKKHSNNNIANKAAELLTSYKEKTIKIASKSIPLSKLLTVGSAILGLSFYASGIKNSIKSQLGLIRKASFDATQSIINDPKLFAILTDEQQAKIDSIVKYDDKNHNEFINTLKDKINLSSTFSSVKEYRDSLSGYQKQKEEYFKSISGNNNTTANEDERLSAEEDKILFTSLVKNVEHDVLEQLRKVETVSNISYSSLFTGGFLEYLLTDKLVKSLGIKNKIPASIVKFGAPLITYLLLNKNISDIENKAILATKYKHLKQFVENPLNYSSPKEEKQSLPAFLKSVYQDMKEYDKFEKDELPKIKQRLEAQRTISLSPEQEKAAERLQKNTSMVINKHREELLNNTVGIESFSETILGPIDILSTAIGAFIGNNLAKKVSNPKQTKLFSAIGAILAFIPAAAIEAKLTKEQKLAEKISAMRTLKNIQDTNLFLSNTTKTNSEKKEKTSEIFKDFLN